MRSCRDLEPLLAAYVDGEMPPPQLVTVQSHLAACPSCRHAVAGQRAAREVLHTRRHQLLPQASPQLRQRCAACACGPRTLRAGSAVARAFAQRTWRPLSLAATVLLVAAAVFFMWGNSSVDALATQLALDHVKCFQFAPPHTEVDASVAGAAWKTTYGWRLTVPRSAPVEQLELLDVRRCLSSQGASAHLLYRWRGAPLSVYILNSLPKSEIHTERLVSRIGEEALIWADAGRTYAVVSRATPSELEHIAHYLRASTR